MTTATVRRPAQRRRLATFLLVQCLLAASWLATSAVATAHDTDVRHLDGTWERLPAPPNGTGMDVTDAVMLPDGEIVILNTIRRGTNSGVCVARFSPDGDWNEQPITGSWPDGGPCFNDYEQFAVAPDRRLYSTATAIDPSSDPWQVEPSQLWDIADSDAELPLAVDTDGLLYVMAPGREADRSVTRFVTVDVSTGATGRTAALQRWNWWPIAGPSESVYAMHLSRVIARYDPDEDAWLDEAPAAPAELDRTSAALGPDGRIYVLGDDVSPFPELWAWDGNLGEWLPVPIPDDLNGEFWKPELVAGEDGVLYAMDMRQPYRFVPGEVAEPSDPSDGGYGGPTAPTATPASSASASASASASESPSASPTPTPTATPTPVPTVTEEPSATVSPSESPTASADAAAASATVDDGGPMLLLLLLLALTALLAIGGVFGWRWHQQRHSAPLAGRIANGPSTRRATTPPPSDSGTDQIHTG